MNSHAPLFEETGDDSADQLVLKLNQACQLLMQQNQRLSDKAAELEQQLHSRRDAEASTKQKLESLIQRLKLLEQEA
jgi:predicted ribosome quality control (RQC) complex YloA/Tae2 family protein